MYVQLIKNRRKLKGYSQQDMANMLKTSRRTYFRMENENLTMRELEDICKILDLAIQIVPIENIKLP